MSDFPVVARTADFEGRGGIHTAEGGGGGRPVPEPQGVPCEVRAVPKPFPDGFQEDKLRDGGQNIGSPVDMLVDKVARMQKDLAMLREENLVLRTPAASQVIQADGGRRSRRRMCRGLTELLVGNNIIRCLRRLYGGTAETMIQQHYNCSRT